MNNQTIEMLMRGKGIGRLLSYTHRYTSSAMSYY